MGKQLGGLPSAESREEGELDQLQLPPLSLSSCPKIEDIVGVGGQVMMTEMDDKRQRVESSPDLFLPSLCNHH